MATIKVKGYEFNVPLIRDSHSRRAQKFKNNIITTLKAIGLSEDDVEIELEAVAIKRVPAQAAWYLEGMYLEYSYKAGKNFVENLFVVSKVIEFEVAAVIAGEKTIEEFIHDFSEDEDVELQRKAAREYLGLDHDTIDLDLINKTYKKLAKAAHPDMPTGSTEKFKELNNAHKILKRELE